jgi:hypothetical protein
VKPASPCFAKLLKGKDSHRLLWADREKKRAVSHNFQFRWVHSTIPTSTITQDYRIWAFFSLLTKWRSLTGVLTSSVASHGDAHHAQKQWMWCLSKPDEAGSAVQVAWGDFLTKNSIPCSTGKKTDQGNVYQCASEGRQVNFSMKLNGISLAFDSCPVLVISSSCHTVINPAEKDMGVTVYS